MTVWRMRITCWLPKAANINLEYVIATYLFFTAKIVMRTRFIVTVYNHLLYC